MDDEEDLKNKLIRIKVEDLIHERETRKMEEENRKKSSYGTSKNNSRDKVSVDLDPFISESRKKIFFKQNTAKKNVLETESR